MLAPGYTLYLSGGNIIALNSYHIHTIVQHYSHVAPLNTAITKISQAVGSLPYALKDKKTGELVTAHRLVTDLMDTVRENSDPLTIAAVAAAWGVQCWHEGRISDDDWLPHFTCKVVGDALVDIMRDRPSKKMLVLCGHTHGAGVAHPLPNLEVRTGGADYYEPEVQAVLHF